MLYFSEHPKAQVEIFKERKKISPLKKMYF